MVDGLFQNQYVLVLTLLFPAMTIWQSQVDLLQKSSSAEASRELTEKIKQITHARNPVELRKAYRLLLGNATSENLADLKHSSDTGICLSSAWEECRRRFPQDDKAVIDKAENPLQYFLGFLEGKLDCHCPSWWKETLSTARISQKGNFYFQAKKDPPTERKSDIGLQAVIEVLPSALQSNMTIRIAGEDTMIPAVIHQFPFGQKVRLSILVIEPEMYVGCHNNSCFPFYLYSIDHNTNKLRWKSEVWGSGLSISNAIDSHWVTIFVRKDLVFVFGAGSQYAYIEVFNRKDGNNRLRFNSGHIGGSH